MVRNSVITSLDKMNECHFWENRPFIGYMPEQRSFKAEEIRKTIKKKSKRSRTAFTTTQIQALERIYTKTKYISTEHRREVSKTLNIGDKSVKVWFQNRRMKEKREFSESNSDSSSVTIADNDSPSQSTATELPVFVEDTFNAHPPDLNQYQVPDHYFYNATDQEHFTAQSSEYNVQANDYQYNHENHFYPTEYFPHNNTEYTNEYKNYYQYQPQNLIYNNFYEYNDEAFSYRF